MSIKTFVTGHPIAHSRSPLIHNHWLETFGIEGSYVPLDVTAADFPDLITAIRAGNFVGGNVTVPHKRAAYNACDALDPDAKIIGAVNTLVMRDNSLLGFNTDLAGFLGNLDQQAPGWDAQNREAIVLGAGGAARAVLVGLARRGFGTVHILNRTLQTAKKLADELPGPFSAGALNSFDTLAPKANIVVNTTTIGMHNTRFEGLALEQLPKTAVVTDIVYTPLKTPLLADAHASGLKTVNGLGMLLHQAVPGFEAWFGTRPKVTAELRALVLKNLGLA